MKKSEKKSEEEKEEKSQWKGSKPVFMCGVCACVVVCGALCGFVCCLPTGRMASYCILADIHPLRGRPGCDASSNPKRQLRAAQHTLRTLDSPCHMPAVVVHQRAHILPP